MINPKQKLGSEDFDVTSNINLRNKLKHGWSSGNTWSVLTSLACVLLQLSHLKAFFRLFNKRLYFVRGMKYKWEHII